MKINKAIEEELEKVRREVFLFEYFNNRLLEVKNHMGEKLYDIADEQLQQALLITNLFALFGVNKITDYKKNYQNKS